MMNTPFHLDFSVQADRYALFFHLGQRYILLSYDSFVEESRVVR